MTLRGDVVLFNYIANDLMAFTLDTMRDDWKQPAKIPTTEDIISELFKASAFSTDVGGVETIAQIIADEVE